MSEYVVISDVGADIPAEVVEKIGIGMMPMDFEVDGKNYKHYYDSREMSGDEFYDRIKNGSMPKTSQITPFEYEEFLKPYLDAGKDILLLVFSSGLSSTYQSSVMAVEELKEDYPDRKIYTVDSICASVGQSLLIYLAMQKKNEGLSIEELRDWIISNRLKVAHWFMVDDLNHLKRGGRVSSVSAVFGTALNIKPMITLDENGKLDVVDKVRGTKKGLSYIVDKITKEGKDSQEQTVIIGYTDRRELAEELEKTLLEKGLIKDAIIAQLGPIIGAHVGTGFVALVYMTEENLRK